MDSFTWDEYSKRKCAEFEKGGNVEPVMPRLDRSIFTEKPMFSLEAVKEVYKLREEMARRTGDTKTLRELIHGEHSVPATYRHLNSDTIKHMWGKDLIRNLRRFPTRMEEEDKIALRKIVLKQFGETQLDTAGITQKQDEDLDEEVVGARAIDAGTDADPVSAKATGGRTIPVIDEDDHYAGTDPDYDKKIHGWVEKRLEELGKRNDERGRDEFKRYEREFATKHPDEHARWRADYDARLKRYEKYRADASADARIGAGKGIPPKKKTSADLPRWIDGKENPEWRKLHDEEKKANWSRKKESDLVPEHQQEGTHDPNDSYTPPSAPAPRGRNAPDPSPSIDTHEEDSDPIQQLIDDFGDMISGDLNKP